MVLNGKPIDEPVFQYDSMIMNSDVELRDAIREYRRRQKSVSVVSMKPTPAEPTPPSLRTATPALPRERLAYSLHEAAELLGIDYFSVYRLVQVGKLRACRAMRRKLIIPRTELLKMLRVE